jgi:hypothetical protein
MVKFCVVLAAAASLVESADAQVQVRIGDATRATYSELHEGLRSGTPAADSVLRILRSNSPRQLWVRMRAAVNGTGDWNSGLIALTRLATLRNRAYADSAARLRRRLERDESGAPFPNNPGLKAEDLLPSLQAIILERRRQLRGDSVVLADILKRIPAKDYDHGDAWVLGRLGAGAADSVAARFRAADSQEFRVRYLTLLSYFTDPGLIPLLSRVYVAPDSFGIPQALRHARVGRATLDRNPREPPGTPGRPRGGREARGLRRLQPRPRRLRLPGQRQLRGNLADRAVAQVVDCGAAFCFAFERIDT